MSNYGFCPICEEDFKKSKHNQKYCNDCLENRKYEIYKYAAQQKKIKEERKARQEGIKTIDQVIAELEAYNKKHGTCISYGKYVEMMYLGQVKK